MGEPRQSEATRAGSDSAAATLHRLVSAGSYDGAIDLVARCGLTADGNDLTSMLVAKAEAGFLANAYRTRTPPGAVPHRQVAESSPDGTPLHQNESFLLELIDGRWDVRSLVWIAPMRKVDTVRALLRLIDLEYIDMAGPMSADRPGQELPVVGREDIDNVLDATFG